MVHKSVQYKRILSGKISVSSLPPTAPFTPTLYILMYPAFVYTPRIS